MQTVAEKIIEDVAREILASPEKLRYVENIFADASGCPIEHPHEPLGPGGESYGRHSTAYELMGADPGHIHDNPIDVSQDDINNYRRSFREALKIAFPDDALKAFFQVKLDEGEFEDQGQSAEIPVDNLFDHFLPRILPEASPKSEGSFAVTFEHEIRRQTKPEESVLDQRDDRRNMTNRDLARTYGFTRGNPNVWLGFHLWQKTLSEYSAMLRQKLEQHDPELPILHAIKMVENTAIASDLPLFSLASILANKAGPNLSYDGEITDQDFIEGIKKASTAGVLIKKKETQFGERTVLCPAGHKALSIMLLDLSEAGSDDTKPAVGAFYEKGLELLEDSPKVQTIRDDILKGIDQVLNNSHPATIEIELTNS